MWKYGYVTRTWDHKTKRYCQFAWFECGESQGYAAELGDIETLGMNRNRILYDVNWVDNWKLDVKKATLFAFADLKEFICQSRI